MSNNFSNIWIFQEFQIFSNIIKDDNIKNFLNSQNTTDIEAESSILKSMQDSFKIRPTFIILGNIIDDIYP